MSIEHHGPVEELSTDESMILMASEQLGRLALSVGGLPEIFPINFIVNDGKILFRTAEGTKLLALTINAHVAIEADSFSRAEAWSVVVKGTARALENEQEIFEANKLTLTPWVPTLKQVFVEITPTEVTGRRFDIGPEPERY
ncbi:MAG: pyridoxamine 5'-phosphate oxidase family protein [Microbacteriaceae bacterium]|jgi:nitroimidazol reductase NimA-like FMN-containing flavoprotein (pyridoxamine 5'-phosphate oxidase superfamily)